MSFTIDTEIKTFGGKILKLSHDSTTVNSKMNVNVYLPPQYYDASTKKIPVLLYLSGLTCTPNNVTEKGFWYPFANKYGFALVFPDTSPREVSINDDSWYVGTGAGFYIDAETPEWSKNYKMYSYIDKELPTAVASQFPKLDFDNYAISGHSMGGYGSILHFLTSGKYKSCSAFSPLSNVNSNTWTELAFAKYLGEDRSKWAKYDLAKIIAKYSKELDSKILVHVGLADSFYNELKVKSLVENSKGTKLEGKFDVNEVEGYDHSYFFISTFVEEHAKHHARYLGLL